MYSRRKFDLDCSVCTLCGSLDSPGLWPCAGVRSHFPGGTAKSRPLKKLQAEIRNENYEKSFTFCDKFANFEANLKKTSVLHEKISFFFTIHVISSDTVIK